MISKIEIRAAIKFCFKLKKTAKETLELIQTAYGEEGMSRKNVKFMESPPRQCAGSQSVGREGVFGPKRRHSVGPPALFARSGSV